MSLTISQMWYKKNYCKKKYSWTYAIDSGLDFVYYVFFNAFI